MEHGHGEIQRDENGQYVVENEGRGEVQNIQAQTPQDLKQQIDNIRIRGRTECVCSFSSDEVLAVLRSYNDTYKSRRELLGWSEPDVSKIPGSKGETLAGMSGMSNESMAFVISCADGVKIPFKMQQNTLNVKDVAGNVTVEKYRCFELPPSNDSVGAGVEDIRARINDTMYEGGGSSGKKGGHGSKKKGPSFLRRVLKSIPILGKAA